MNEATDSGGAAQDSWPLIRSLRAVIPIAHTVVHGYISITLFAIEDYVDGFDLSGRLIVGAEHPLAPRRYMESLEEVSATERMRSSAPEVMPMSLQVVRAGDQIAERPQVHGTRRAPLPFPLLRAADDAGTAYYARPLGGGGDGRQYHFDFKIVPSIHRAARRLLVAVDEVRWGPLAAHLARRDLPPFRTDAGPWEFQVDLERGLRATSVGG